MIYKIKNRLLLSSLIVFVLIFFILIENPIYSNMTNSILGNVKFVSFFDKIKFFLPITLLLSITSDYVSYILGKEGSIIITRFGSRKKLTISIFKGLYFSVLIFWSIIMLLGIVLSTWFNKKITGILNVNFFIIFITGYLLYNMIATIQLLLSMFLDINKSFIIVVALAVISTLVTDNFTKYIFIIPLGMGLNKTSLIVGIVRTILVIIITILSAIIIHKKIERLNVG